MNQSTEKSASTLSRRTILRGAGCAVGLPWLESMHALADTPKSSDFAKRFGVVFEKMMTVVEHSLDVEIGNPEILGPVQMMDQRIRVTSQRVELRKKTPSYDVQANRGFSASRAINWWMDDMVLDLLHQKGVTRARGEGNDIGRRKFVHPVTAASKGVVRPKRRCSLH